MARPVNPYIAGNPIRDKGFFGRVDILDWVAQELRNPGTSAIVLFGQRRIGKTTLLIQLQNALPADEFLPVFFDLQDQARRSLGQVLTDLAENMADEIEMEPPAEKIDARGRAFRKEFLPAFLAKLGENRRPVFLLDEFDVLDKSASELPEDSAANSLFPFLRQIMPEFPALAFVFVAGRNPEDLSLDFSATFKASLVREVWVLDAESAQKLIRQTETNGTLQFAEAAVERILALTHYHPYLTQLLCQRIWERAYADKPAVAPIIDIEQVDSAVMDSLATGNSALQWVWDGLSAAERVYAAALAESAEENQPIAEDKVIQVLSEYANRLRTREVELAPRDLVKRRVLEEAGDHQYAFAIELLRRWVRKNRPLKSVKNELDRDDRTADGLFVAGESYFQKKKWQDAREAFEKAIRENQRHLKAHLYLGETLLEMGNSQESVAILKKAFELDRDEARLPLARAWVAYATMLQNNGDEDSALEACEAALELSPKERGAQTIKIAIWNKRAEKALAAQDLSAALVYFGNAGNETQVKSLQERLQQEEELKRHFIEGLGALQQAEWARARDAFQWIVSRQPDYKYNGQKAAHLLAQAVDEGEQAPHPLLLWVRRPQNRALLLGVLMLFILSIGIGMGMNLFRSVEADVVLTNTSTLTPVFTFTSTLTPVFTLTPTLTVTQTPILTNTSLPPTPAFTYLTDPKGVEMGLIPAGEFTMGIPAQQAEQSFAACQKSFNNGCFRGIFIAESPSHLVTLKTYYIDKYEVTNVFYKACVDAGICKPLTKTSSYTRSRYYGNSQFDNYPVIYVDWNMAKTYCEWRGARLPTEAEWEKAARGTDDRTYPWGEAIDGTFLNFNNAVGDTTTVGSYESGKSPYGIYDMAGNVWEWVADWYEAYPGGDPNASVAFGKKYRVMRGGSWSNDGFYQRVSHRNYSDYSIENETHLIGFRCAKSAIP